MDGPSTATPLLDSARVRTQRTVLGLHMADGIPSVLGNYLLSQWFAINFENEDEDICTTTAEL